MVDVEMRCCRGRRYDEAYACSRLAFVGMCATFLLYFVLRACALDAVRNEVEIHRTGWINPFSSTNRNETPVDVYLVLICPFDPLANTPTDVTWSTIITHIDTVCRGELQYPFGGATEGPVMQLVTMLINAGFVDLDSF